MVYSLKQTTLFCTNGRRVSTITREALGGQRWWSLGWGVVSHDCQDITGHRHTLPYMLRWPHSPQSGPRRYDGRTQAEPQATFDPTNSRPPSGFASQFNWPVYQRYLQCFLDLLTYRGYCQLDAHLQLRLFVGFTGCSNRS